MPPSTLKFRPTVTFEGPVRTLVSPAVAPDLLAVLGEALSNASRHAQAAHGRRSCWRPATRSRSPSRDDGKGLPENVVESGLGNIRQRAERHGGSFEIVTAPGDGATLLWSVPVTTG